MDIIKKLLTYLFVAALAIAGISIGRHYNLITCSRNLGKTPTLSAQEFYAQKLDQEQEAIWQEFSKIGINKKRFQQAKKKLYPNYMRADVPFSNKRVSARTEKFVRAVMEKCGLDQNKITIAGYDDRSPAAATEKVIYVNEQVFSSLSASAQRFVIGHEIQHILHGDNADRYVLETLAGCETETLTPQKANHPLLQYSRFKERRADIETALQGTDWAESYHAFAQERLEKLGDTPGVTHPKHSERLHLAKAICNHMKHDQQDNAVKMA